MIPRYDVVIEWDPDGHYVGCVRQIPSLRMEGESPDKLEYEISEVISELLRIDGKPPEEFEFNVIRR